VTADKVLRFSFDLQLTHVNLMKYLIIIIIIIIITKQESANPRLEFYGKSYFMPRLLLVAQELSNFCQI